MSAIRASTLVHGQVPILAGGGPSAPALRGVDGGVAVIKTLLLIDLLDSTGLLEQLGDARAQEVFAAHDQMARSLLPALDGREIDKTDGFLLLFDRPIQAVSYALAYHQELAALGERLDLPLAARAGIHLGEVFLRENLPEDVAKGAKLLEVDGLAKHTVARVAGLAQGRQTLLTHAAFDLARRAVVGSTADRRPSWLAHGPYLFQGIQEPVDVFEVGMAGVAPLGAPRDTSKARRAVPDGDEVTLGWRPAAGQEVPWRHHWVLDRKLGDGGFGEVWLARHERTGDHRVFKFCYDAQRLRALRREVTLFRILKDTLGERDDIGRILDWNFKEPPFFLESDYTGTDLQGWIESQGGAGAVPLATRLEIIAQIAKALAAAHSVGVLHKDIKPGNILIAIDSEGRPKARLSDFGIGLLTDPQKISVQGLTFSGFTEMMPEAGSTAAGTRLYLAPELLEGKTPSIQSDIYALGVLLFQMVVGDLSHVLAPGWEREIPDELLVEDIAHAVDGDPAKRPASAIEIAERLHRIEERRQARAEALRAKLEAERMRQALARARVLAVITALVLVFAIAMALQMRRTAQEAKRANSEAEAAHRISDFLVGLFQLSDPDAAMGSTVTARELLDQGAARIETELEHQPEVRASLMQTMGEAYLKLGLYDSAVRLLRQSLRLRQQAYGVEHPLVAESLHELGYALFLRGDYDAAENVLKQALAMRRKLFGESHATVARTLNYLAAVKAHGGQYAEAERLDRQALAILAESGEDVSRQRAEVVSDLAVMLESQGKDEGVEPMYDEALSLLRQLVGEEHTDVSRVLANKGNWLITQGRFAEAEACLQQALAIKRKRLGDRHPTVAFTLYKLADLLNAQGRHVRAEELATEALSVLRDKLPPGHWRILYTESVLGAALAGQGRFAEAEALLVPSYPVLRDSVGARAEKTQRILRSLVELYDAWGRPREAERYRALLSAPDKVGG
ncbi:MAG TPA: tetratricopeptide repeat protein [Thermoanaerobaculia bacterium]|nr:tetratricopeptide repeat protein [Thermoanaerobaculia bacterium]